MSGQFKYLTTARNGLRFRSSPHDGETLLVLKQGSEVEILDSETWHRVKTEDGQVGYVHGDYIEPLEKKTDPDPSPISSDSSSNESHGRIIYYSKRMTGKQLVIDQAFKPKVDKLDAWLKECDLYLEVTSSLRKPGQIIHNAVVEPARMSNHLVGHAIDMNLYTKDEDGGISSWFNSSEMEKLVKGTKQNDTEPQKSVNRFLSGLLDKTSLRWGGFFRKSDPVHIDDALNIKNEKEYREAFRAIWG